MLDGKYDDKADGVIATVTGFMVSHPKTVMVIVGVLFLLLLLV